MPIADLAATPARPAPAFAQFPTAWRFALRNQTRNRLAGLLLVVFVPVWYLLMAALAGHQPLSFKLFATGQVLIVDARSLTLITAGLNALTLITGFAVFAAIRRTLASISGWSSPATASPP
jgi:ABC-2 type transport system permease protein